MATASSAAKLTPASNHMCHTRAKPSTVLIPARMMPAAVFFGIWMALKPCSGRRYLCCFICHQASRSCTRGVKAKLYCGGGDEVAHSRVRPSQGSPVVSRS